MIYEIKLTQNINEYCWPKRNLTRFLSSLILLTLLSIATIVNGQKPADVNQINSLIGNEQVAFIENLGQLADDDGNPLSDVYFYANLPGSKIYITKWGLTYFFLKTANKTKSKHSPNDPPETIKVDWERMDVVLNNVSISPLDIVKEYQVAGVYNYYYPHCKQGILGVREYKKITIKNVYRGVDWVLNTNLDSSKQGFTQDFIVHPGGDYRNIELMYSGLSDLKTHCENGGLVAATKYGIIKESEAIGYSNNHQVAMQFKKVSENLFAYDVKGDYDKDKDLIIDPNVLVWATFYGGNLLDYGNSIISNGSTMYASGYTSSTNLPCQNPGNGAYYQGSLVANYDAILLAFDIAGTRKSATYFGGGGNDFGNCISLDGSNVWIAGSTYSSNLPLLNPGGSAYYQSSLGGTENAFILKFDTVGVLVWATYYGGSTVDSATSIVSDGTNVWVTGKTTSTNLPLQNPGGGAYYQGTKGSSSDAFILKFSVAGVRSWATYFGGNGADVGTSISVYGSDVFIGLNTSSDNLALQTPSGAYTESYTNGQDIFIAKFNTSGVKQWSTYYGADQDEFLTCLHTDGTYLWVTGYVQNSSFPLMNQSGAYNQTSFAGSDEIGFILKFKEGGTRKWATLYGGDVNTQPTSIISSGNSVWLTGTTESSNFPTQNPGAGAFYQPHNSNLSQIISASWDDFILQFDTSGVRQWATYYGADNDDFGKTIFFDGTYLWAIGYVASSNIYLLNPGGGAYYQTSFAGANNSVILKFGVPQSLPVEFLSFTGEKSNLVNNLHWMTATERNNHHFEIERSADGLQFQCIGHHLGHGNCNQINNYDFTDVNPNQALNYYRLKQVDYDGAIAYSNTIVITDNNGRPQCNIANNNGTGPLILHCHSLTNVTISIYDLNSKLVKKETYSDLNFDTQFSIQDLEEGLFLMQIQADNYLQNFKILKNN